MSLTNINRHGSRVYSHRLSSINDTVVPSLGRPYRLHKAVHRLVVTSISQFTAGQLLTLSNRLSARCRNIKVLTIIVIPLCLFVTGPLPKF